MFYNWEGPGFCDVWSAEGTKYWLFESEHRGWWCVGCLDWEYPVYFPHFELADRGVHMFETGGK